MVEWGKEVGERGNKFIVELIKCSGMNNHRNEIAPLVQRQTICLQSTLILAKQN